jgi:lipoate-protein ligase A
MGKARVIIDEPAAGDWNMAVDHALLETANSTGLISVRFYAWSQPTLSLGYFQPQALSRQHHASLHCPQVRRSTGGGAIVHDQEITYSLCVPSNHRWSTENEQLYSMVHQILCDLLAQYKVDAKLFELAATPQKKEAEFLCFLRRSQGDLIVAGNKIGGSAQRRRKNALLQHGSVLLKRSPSAPELAGIEDLTGVQIDPAELINRWIPRLEESLEIELPVIKLTEIEYLAAQDCKKSTYSSDPWTNRR